MYWNAKLGNLILLPLTSAGASSMTTADFDHKAMFYQKVRQAPGWKANSW